jgi:hypothetical protein
VEAPFGGAVDDSNVLAWKRGAACRGLPVEIFFSRDHSAALELCNNCRVVDDCLHYTVEFEKRVRWCSGVAGGMAPGERERKFQIFSGSKTGG